MRPLELLERGDWCKGSNNTFVFLKVLCNLLHRVLNKYNVAIIISCTWSIKFLWQGLVLVPNDQIILWFICNQLICLFNFDLSLLFLNALIKSHEISFMNIFIYFCEWFGSKSFKAYKLVFQLTWALTGYLECLNSVSFLINFHWLTEIQ